MTNAHQDIWSFDCLQSVQLAAVQALQASGVRVVSPGGESSDSPSNKTGSFGVPITCTSQQTLPISFRGNSFQLPRVFVECVQFLEDHTECEGLFRKAGSVNRQKALRTSLQNGNSLSKDANIHDVASLLKQYLRLLPDLLFTSHLSPVFEACVTLVPKEEQVNCLLLACLVLPQSHLQCLSVLMTLLSKVCEMKDGSRMTASNLAIVMAPNLLTTLSSVSDFVTCGNPLLAQTTIIQYLIENCNLIGQVPHEVGVASESCKSTIRAAKSFEDMIQEEVADLPERYSKRKKLRTASLSGLVLGLGNRLKQKGSAIFSGDSTTSSPGDKKRMSVKRRRGSDDDLLRERHKMINSNHMSALQDSRHSIRSKTLRNGSKSKLRPFSGRQRAYLLAKPKQEHMSVSGPILFQKGMTSQVKFYPITPSLSPPLPKLESSPVEAPEDKGQVSSTEEVSTALEREISHQPVFSTSVNLKRSASEPDILSSAAVTPDVPYLMTSKRICLEENIRPLPMSAKKIPSSQSAFTLSSRKLPIRLKFSAPLPVPFPPSQQQDEACKLPDHESESFVSSQTCSGEDAITESRTQNSPFHFSIPTPIHHIKRPLTHVNLNAEFDASPCASADDEKIPTPSCHAVFPVSPGGSTSEFDKAFLQTPHVGAVSPNLMEKINSEIVQRTRFVPVKETTQFSNDLPSCTPLTPHQDLLQHVNESYKKAVLGNDTFDKRFQQGTARSGFKAPRARCLVKQTNSEADSAEKVPSDESYGVVCPPVALEFDNSSLVDENQTPASVGSQPSPAADTTATSDPNFKSPSGVDDTPCLNDGNVVLEPIQEKGETKTVTLKINVAHSKDDKGISPTADTTIASVGNSERHQQAHKGSVLSPTHRYKVYSGKSPVARQGAKMKAISNNQTKQRYAYSATLGMGDSLVHMRTHGRQKLMSPVKTPPKQQCTPVSLSAALGITTLGEDNCHFPTQHPKKPHCSRSSGGKSDVVCSTIDGRVPVIMPEACPQLADTDSKGVTSHDSSCDINSDPWPLESTEKSLVPEECVSPSSPAPTLLKIVQANVAQSHKKLASYDHATSHTSPPPSESTTPLKNLSNSPLQNRASDDSTLGDLQQTAAINRAIIVGNSRKPPDVALAKQRVKLTPFGKGVGLMTPWFPNIHGRQKSCNSVTPSGGTYKRRAELYIVKSSPLRASPVSVSLSNSQVLPSNDSDKENQCCYGKLKSSSCQQEGKVEVEEWVV